MSKLNSKKLLTGFTLIELLVVIAIIGLLTSVILVALNSARDKARIARTAADLRQMITMLNLYLDDNGQYPCFDHDQYSDAAERAWSAPYGTWPKPVLPTWLGTFPANSTYHWDHYEPAGPYFIQFWRPQPAALTALYNILGPYFGSSGVGGTSYFYGIEAVAFQDIHCP